MRNALLLCLLPLVSACRDSTPAPEPVRPVKSLVVGGQTAGGGGALPGELRAEHESPLAFRVGGKVVECRANLGDTVRRGQVLARLETADYQLGAQSGAAGVSEARSNLEFAEADFERYRKLREQGFVSSAQLEQKKMQREAAKARLVAVQSGHDMQSRQLAYTALTADHDGVLTAAECNPGQVVAAGQPLLRLAQDGGREIEIHLPEDVMPRLGRATKFTVRFAAMPGKTFPGKLRELAAAADPATRTYTARIRLQGNDPALRLGMSASVTLDGGAEQAMRLPLAAVLGYDGKPQVWKVDQVGMVHAASVTVAGIDGNEVRIASGLTAGDVVVTAGANLLREGQTVRLMR
jgi:RND family efflux transporter MFP subunit